jgi:hypothetical protein
MDMKTPMKNLVFCSLFLFALASPGQGEVTIVNQWRLGGGSSALADDIGGATLTAFGPTVSAAGIAPGSPSSQDFQNTVGNVLADQYMTATASIGSTDNWGVSVWVNADSIADAESQFLKIGVINLQTLDGKWTVHHQGSELTTFSGPEGVVSPGVDYHVCYVNQGGFASLYVNGVNLGDVIARASSIEVIVGAQLYIGEYRKGWDGRIDEITLFTFEEGEFDASDLDNLGGGLTPLEAWRLANFGNASNTGIGADSADPDGDGENNLAEYTAGTDPNNSQDFFKITTASLADESFTVTTSGKSGRKYFLDQSPTLAEGTWTSVATLGPLASDATVELSDPAPAAGAGFYRIRVQFP